MNLFNIYGTINWIREHKKRLIAQISAFLSAVEEIFFFCHKSLKTKIFSIIKTKVLSILSYCITKEGESEKVFITNEWHKRKTNKCFLIFFLLLMRHKYWISNEVNII